MKQAEGNGFEENGQEMGELIESDQELYWPDDEGDEEVEKLVSSLHGLKRPTDAKKEQAKLETEKYQKDRMELRKKHERMRNKKMEEMMAGGQKDTPENFLEKNIRTISANRSQ